MAVITTKNATETQRLARILAKELRPAARARVIALQGELGAGKTTFAQGFARALGVTERVVSPTFVIMKTYGLRPRVKDKNKRIKDDNKIFRRLVHIDCYRLRSSKDILHLGFKEILKDKDAIILIEWTDRIKKILTRDTIWITLTHGVKPHQRIIAISES